MKIAYLVNQYPAITHTFIRREIQEIESLGLEVKRYSIRRTKNELRDPADQREQALTRTVLDQKPHQLLAAMTRVARRRPVAFARAARLATELGVGSDRGMIYQGAYLMEACALLEWLEEEKIEHLHAHFGTNSASVALLARTLGGPTYSFTVHGPEEFDKPDAIKLARKVVDARFVVAISSFGRSQIWRRVRSRDWPKVHVVHCGLDRAYVDLTPTPVPDVARICCVGRLCEQKGQALLVEAVARLVHGGTPIELVLVGDGETRPEIEQLIAARGIERNVRITGWASGAMVREEIQASRAMVLPSFAEGLPVVITEAFAMGRPVISTYVAGIPELVQTDKCGWLVPAGNVERLERAIAECLRTNTHTLSRMGRVGRNRVLNGFDIRQSALALQSLLQGGIATEPEVEDADAALEDGSTNPPGALEVANDTFPFGPLAASSTESHPPPYLYGSIPPNRVSH